MTISQKNLKWIIVPVTRQLLCFNLTPLFISPKSQKSKIQYSNTKWSKLLLNQTLFSKTVKAFKISYFHPFFQNKIDPNVEILFYKTLYLLMQFISKKDQKYYFSNFRKLSYCQKTFAILPHMQSNRFKVTGLNHDQECSKGHFSAKGKFR